MHGGISESSTSRKTIRPMPATCAARNVILTAPNCPLSGEYEGARLLDIALLYWIWPDTKFRRRCKGVAGGGDGKETIGWWFRRRSGKIVHDRLAGLGYV